MLVMLNTVVAKSRAIDIEIYIFCIEFVTHIDTVKFSFLLLHAKV